MKKKPASKKASVSSNKVLFITFCIAVGILVALYFITREPEKVYTLKQTTDAEILAKNRPLFNQYLHDADSVARLSGDTRTAEIVSFLRENGRISKADYYGAIPLEDTSRGGWVAIVLVMPGDDMISQQWYNVIHGNAVAAYADGEKMLILKPSNPVGKLCRSLTILHEGMHAWKDYMQNGQFRNKQA